MIGESKEQIAEQTNKGLVAFRDALVVFMLVLVTNLLQVQYPPTPEVCWQPLLAGLLMGIVSYMRALGIQKPEQ